MTEKTIELLERYGKLVYINEISLKEAAAKVSEEADDVSASSAAHYIKW